MYPPGCSIDQVSERSFGQRADCSLTVMPGTQAFVELLVFNELYIKRGRMTFRLRCTKYGILKSIYFMVMLTFFLIIHPANVSDKKRWMQ